MITPELYGRYAITLMDRAPFELRGMGPWDTWCGFSFTPSQLEQSIDCLLAQYDIVGDCLSNKGKPDPHPGMAHEIPNVFHRYGSFEMGMWFIRSMSDDKTHFYCRFKYQPNPATLNMPVYHWLGALAEAA